MKWIDTAYSQLSPATRGQLPLAISRKPFFLYPADMQETVPQRWGERVSKLYSPATWTHIKQLGLSAGYAFNYDAPLSDSMDSHRLCLLAEEQGGPSKQKEVVHEISRRYFEQGVPLADRSSLLEVASKFGVDGAEAYLNSNAGVVLAFRELVGGKFAIMDILHCNNIRLICLTIGTGREEVAPLTVINHATSQ